MKGEKKKQKKMKRTRKTKMNSYNGKKTGTKTKNRTKSAYSKPTHYLHLAHVLSGKMSPEDILSNEQLSTQIGNSIIELSEQFVTLVLYPMKLSGFVNEILSRSKEATFVRYTDFVNRHVICDDVFESIIFLSYPDFSLPELTHVAPQFFQTDLIAFKTDTHYENRSIGNTDYQIEVKVYTDRKLQKLVEYLREELIKDAVIHAINSFDEVREMYLFMDIVIPDLKISKVIGMDQVVAVSRYVENHFDELKLTNDEEGMFIS